MKIIRSIITILLTLSLCLCTFGAEAAAKTADKTAVSVSDSAKNIRVSDKSITLEEGQSVKVTVYTGGKSVKYQRSTKAVSCKAGKTKKGKFTLTVTGVKEGSCTITLYDKNNKSDKCRIKVTVTEATYYTFRTEELYESHFLKHGAEFGDITKQEYLDKANALIDDTSDDVLTKREEDGDYLFFNTETGEFLVLSEDGYIRTFFIPDDGIDYWNRQ